MEIDITPELRSFLEETSSTLREARRLLGQASPWPWTTDDLRKLMADTSGTLRMERDATLTLALMVPDLVERMRQLHNIVEVEIEAAEDAEERLAEDGE